MARSYTSLLGLAAAAAFAAPCIASGGAGVAWGGAALGLGALLAARGRGPEAGAASLTLALVWLLAHPGGSTWPLALGAALLAASALEAPLRVAWRPLLAGAALAVYTGVYGYILYTRIPGATDLPAYTVFELSQPGARAGLVVLGGVYAGILAYSLARPTRATPRLGGHGSLVEALRRHRLAPFWVPLLYLLARLPFALLIASALAVVAALVVVYSVTESADLALAACYAVVALVLWAAGAPIPS